jgi:hypothetical protein
MRLDSTAARRRQVGAPTLLKYPAFFAVARWIGAKTPFDHKKAVLSKTFY